MKKRYGLIGKILSLALAFLIIIQGGTDGGKKGCKSSLGAGALTVVISVALAGFTLVKRKKEN